MSPIRVVAALAAFICFAEIAMAATPTAQEFLRARVFEEPLVPLGGEPTSGENTPSIGEQLRSDHRDRSTWRQRVRGINTLDADVFRLPTESEPTAPETRWQPLSQRKKKT
jgi:hypothetical protein